MDPSSQQDISHPQQAKKPVHHNSKSAINQLIKIHFKNELKLNELINCRL